MGYRIDYAGPEPQIQIPIQRHIRIRTMIAAAFLALCVTVRLLWPEGTSMLQSVFIPGVLTSTEQAFSQLVTDLREGMPLAESVDVFCHCVLNGVS